MVKVVKYRLKRIPPRLHKDEVYCDVCEGAGYTKDVKEDSTIIEDCPHCLGEGKFEDWVKGMIGKDDGKPRRITKCYRKVQPE